MNTLLLTPNNEKICVFHILIWIYNKSNKNIDSFLEQYNNFSYLSKLNKCLPMHNYFNRKSSVKVHYTILFSNINNLLVMMKMITEFLILIWNYKKNNKNIGSFPEQYNNFGCLKHMSSHIQLF